MQGADCADNHRRYFASRDGAKYFPVAEADCRQHGRRIPAKNSSENQTIQQLNAALTRQQAFNAAPDIKLRTPGASPCR
jgi:hypothetical protein